VPGVERRTAARRDGKEIELAPRKSTTSAAEKVVRKPTVRRRKKVTHEMIQERAYHIAISGSGGSPLDHWLTAEHELLGV
jgi:homoserine kinase